MRFCPGPMFGRRPTISTSKLSTVSPWKTVFPMPFIPARTSENGRVEGAAEAAPETANVTATASALARERGRLIGIRRATRTEDYHALAASHAVRDLDAHQAEQVGHAVEVKAGDRGPDPADRRGVLLPHRRPVIEGVEGLSENVGKLR